MWISFLDRYDGEGREGSGGKLLCNCFNVCWSETLQVWMEGKQERNLIIIRSQILGKAKKRNIFRVGTAVQFKKETASFIIASLPHFARLIRAQFNPLYIAMLPLVNVDAIRSNKAAAANSLMTKYPHSVLLYVII